VKESDLRRLIRSDLRFLAECWFNSSPCFESSEGVPLMERIYIVSPAFTEIRHPIHPLAVSPVPNFSQDCYGLTDALWLGTSGAFPLCQPTLIHGPT